VDDQLADTVQARAAGRDPVPERLGFGEFGEELDTPTAAFGIQSRQASGRRHASTLPSIGYVVKTHDTPRRATRRLSGDGTR
jgi:hypothetical protein